MTIMNENLVQSYCACMEDVKCRLAVVNTVTRGELSTGNPVFDYEFVSVQLRKVLEFVAFSSMIANKRIYAAAHADFSRHWRAKRLLEDLEKLHPNFYPQPIKFGHVTESGVKHFDKVKNGYLTRDDFVTLYDLCSETMHTWNPFTDKDRRIDFKRSVVEWVRRIEGLLKMHLMQFVDRDEIWVINMERPEDGKVYAITGAPLSKASRPGS